MDRPAHGLNFRYWIRDLLFSGSQGMVYKAHDLSLNQPCSVKRIDSSLQVTSALQQRFRHEAEILAVLFHPNIVTVYECTEDEQGNPYSVMEPLDGRDLRSLLAEVTSLSVDRTLNILCAVGAALQHAHDLGIVHQDINPSNIFLNKERSRTAVEVEVVKVMNFGMAKQLTPASCGLTRNLHLDLVFDSPTYLAPEALELSSEAVDGRTDQWSLAVLAYQMLSGQLPFWEKDPWCLRALVRSAAAPVPLAELMPELPAYVHSAIHKALSKDKNQRFDNIADFIRALHGLSVPSSKQTKPERRIDLIEQCRSASLLAAAPLPVETPTKEYPALSFPAELLASTDEEPILDMELWPVPRLTPPWTAGKESSRPRAGSRRLPLVGCLALALALALVPAVAALHHLHPAPHAAALSDTRSPPTALPRPAAIVVSSPHALDVQPLALPSSLEPPPVTHESRSGQARHSRQRGTSRAALEQRNAETCRNKLRQNTAQATLAEGLGL